MSEKHIDEATGVETTGHEWDGIRELNNPLPRWWLWTFYATIAWSLAYTIAYPAWPLITTATGGILGYSSRAELRAEVDQTVAARAGLTEALASRPLAEVLADDELRNFAVAGGAAAYRVNCTQCHGTGAQGSPGFPDLNNDDWLWGGDIETLHQTIAHGIRDHADPDTHYSEMPPFDGILNRAEIAETAAYVVSLSREPPSAARAEAGAGHYANFCAACHGDTGLGSRDLGAPNLADQLWLYGSSEEEIAAQIRQPRHGVMPAWSERLGDVTVRKLAVFIHSLGGGE